jgi:hypothetical protein
MVHKVYNSGKRNSKIGNNCDRKISRMCTINRPDLKDVLVVKKGFEAFEKEVEKPL